MLGGEKGDTKYVHGGVLLATTTLSVTVKNTFYQSKFISVVDDDERSNGHLHLGLYSRV